MSEIEFSFLGDDSALQGDAVAMRAQAQMQGYLFMRGRIPSLTILALLMGAAPLCADTVVLEDGVEISRTSHRTTLVPGDDVSGQLQRVQDIANLLWTAQVVADWKLKHPFVPPV